MCPKKTKVRGIKASEHFTSNGMSKNTIVGYLQILLVDRGQAFWVEEKVLVAESINTVLDQLIQCLFGIKRNGDIKGRGIGG